MATWTALTTLETKHDAEALGAAMEGLMPEPTGVGVFEMEDGSGLWEVGGYFEEKPDIAGLALLATLHNAQAPSPCPSFPRPTGSPMCVASWRRSRLGASSSTVQP